MIGMLPRETKDMFCRDCNKQLNDATMKCDYCARAKKAAETKDKTLRFEGKRCCECRASEHEDFDPLVGLCIVKDPDTNKIVQRGYLCEGHVEIRTTDGYDVYFNGKKVE
jgi:hypothetical protein